MQSIICLALGILLGVFLSKVVIRNRPFGTLRVDQSDPDSGSYLFLELYAGKAYKLQKKKYVLFKVDLKNYIP